MDINPGQGGRRLDLQESTHPAGREVNLLFNSSPRPGVMYYLATSDFKVGRPVTSDTSNLTGQTGTEIYISCAINYRATLLEMARSRTGRDADWAWRQLARLAKSGEAIDGLVVEGVEGI